MQVKFDIFWNKNLGTFYKDNSIDTLGKEANVNIDLNKVLRIYVNFQIGEKSYTDNVEILDIENKLIRIPFKTDVIKQGLNKFELVAVMKDNSVLPSQTYTYRVDKSLENPNAVEADTNYPLLIELMDLAGNKLIDMDKSIQKVNTSIENMTNEISNYKEVTTNALNSDISSYKEATTNELEESFNNYSNSTTSSITRALDNKIVEVDSVVSAKFNELDVKFTTKSNEITKTLNDEINKVDNTLTNKVNEVDGVLDATVTTINTEFDKKSKEVDNKVDAKIVEIDNRVNSKITDIDTSLNNKINEVNEVIEEVEASEQVRKEEHTELVNELSSYSSDINNVKDRVDALEAKITDNEVIVDLKNKVNNHEERILTSEKTIRYQGILLNALNDLDDTISIEEEGTIISLPQSDDGKIIIDELQGNTLVNYCINGSEELTLNNEINVQGYNAIIKPSTQYTVAFDTDKSGEVNIDLGGAKTSTTNNVATITTPATLTDDTLRLYGKGIKASNVRLLEGDKTNYIPQYFEGMKSCFEDKEQDNGSYEVEIMSYNENKSNSIQLQLNEPLRGVDDVKDRFVFKDGKLMIERNCGIKIFNGSENWVFDSWTNNNGIIRRFALKANTPSYSYKVSNKYKYIWGDYPDTYYRTDNGSVLVYTQTDKTLDEFKQELKENNLILLGELTEPYYEEIPFEFQKIILEGYENGTLFFDTNIPPTVSVTYSANKPVVAKLNQVDNTTNVNTEDIAITQMAVDFLLMSSLGEEMINFKIKGGTNMSAYFASRIIKGALKYEDVISKYPNYKEDIDLILTAEGYSDLIVEL